MKRMMKWLTPVALLALPGAALAQGEFTEGREPGRQRDISVMGQAGLLTYTGEAAAFTSPGVAYGVIVGMDVMSWVNAEASYQGAAYVTDTRLAPGDTGAAINENGLQVLAKVGPDLGRWEPYAMGGINFTGLNVKDQETAFGLVEDAFLVKVPVGAGLDYTFPYGGGEGDFRVGARASYNLILDSGAFPTLQDDSSANQFQTTLNLGATF